MNDQIEYIEWEKYMVTGVCSYMPLGHIIRYPFDQWELDTDEGYLRVCVGEQPAHW